MSKVPAAIRFWKYVQKSEGCWEWSGALSVDGGYGMFQMNRPRGVVKAHRFSWEIHKGVIPVGVNVLHHCDNPKCVRPDHLFLGNIFDNNKDMTVKERHGMMRFTHDKVFRIRSLYSRYREQLTHQRIADWFGVSKATISHMMTGRNWKYSDGAHEKNIPKRRYNARLEESDVREIRRRRAAGEKLRILAAEFGVGQTQISRVARGTRRNAVV